MPGSSRAARGEPLDAEVIVVGGGVGGLCAAIAAAAHGFEVALFESAPELGGKAGTVSVDGLVLDTGPSVLTLPEVFDDVLALAGEPPLELVRPARWCRYRFANGPELELGQGLAGALDGVRAALGRGPAAELERFLEQARKAWEVAAPRFVFGGAPGPRALLSASPRELLAIRPFTTLYDWICATVTDPHLRALLARFGTYAGSDARLAPAVLGTIAWVELGLGGCGVRGGMHRLVARLASAAAKLGVRLHTSAPVEELLAPRGRIEGVRLSGGQRLRAGAVICNAEARRVFAALLPPALRRELPGVPSYSGRCLLLRDERRERPAHQALLPARYLAELDWLAGTGALADPTITVCAPRVAHAQEPWPGADALFCMVNAPPMPRDARPDPLVGEAEERAFALAVRDRLAAAGVVSAGASPVWQRGVRQLAARFPGSGGALYGLASHSWRAAFQRPQNRVRSVPGLYLCGGSAHPGAGLPLVASSGLRAAEALVSDRRRTRGRPRGAATAALAATALLCAPAPSAVAQSGPARSPSCEAAPGEAELVRRAKDLLARAETQPGLAKEVLQRLSPCASPGARVAAAEAGWRAAEDALGLHRRAGFADAVKLARVAAASAPDQAGAWFWLAMALTSEGSERGLLAMVGHAQEIRAALHQAAERDAGYQGGAPLSGLCGLYHRAPGWPLSFGDKELARAYCVRALEQDPRSYEARLVLAWQARDRGALDEARAHLAVILAGPLDERQPRTHQRYRDEASALAGELR